MGGSSSQMPDADPHLNGALRKFKEMVTEIETATAVKISRPEPESSYGSDDTGEHIIPKPWTSSQLFRLLTEQKNQKKKSKNKGKNMKKN